MTNNQFIKRAEDWLTKNTMLRHEVGDVDGAWETLVGSLATALQHSATEATLAERERFRQLMYRDSGHYANKDGYVHCADMRKAADEAAGLRVGEKEGKIFAPLSKDNPKGIWKSTGI